MAGATELTLSGARRPRVGLVLGDWLMGYDAYLLRKSIYKNMKVLIFQFVDAASQAEATPSWA